MSGTTNRDAATSIYGESGVAQYHQPEIARSALAKLLHKPISNSICAQRLCKYDSNRSGVQRPEDIEIAEIKEPGKLDGHGELGNEPNGYWAAKLRGILFFGCLISRFWIPQVKNRQS